MRIYICFASFTISPPSFNVLHSSIIFMKVCNWKLLQSLCTCVSLTPQSQSAPLHICQSCLSSPSVTWQMRFIGMRSEVCRDNAQPFGNANTRTVRSLLCRYNNTQLHIQFLVCSSGNENHIFKLHNNAAAKLPGSADSDMKRGQKVSLLLSAHLVFKVSALIAANC